MPFSARRLLRVLCVGRDFADGLVSLLQLLLHDEQRAGNKLKVAHVLRVAQIPARVVDGHQHLVEYPALEFVCAGEL